MNLFRSLVAVVVFALGCVAQHWQGNANFPLTPNGPQSFDFTLNNADSSNSGVGTLDKYNTATVNIPLTWARNGAGHILISIDGTLVAILENVPQGQPGGTSGNAELNDGVPPSAGTYERN